MKKIKGVPFYETPCSLARLNLILSLRYLVKFIVVVWPFTTV